MLVGSMPNFTRSFLPDSSLCCQSLRSIMSTKPRSRVISISPARRFATKNLLHRGQLLLAFLGPFLLLLLVPTSEPETNGYHQHPKQQPAQNRPDAPSMEAPGGE